MNSAFRLMLLVVVLAVSGIRARAHGPFDSSAQLLLLDDSFEAITTLGLDGAKQVLLKAGLSEAEANAALANRGPSTPFELSPGIAGRFLEISTGERILKPRSFKVLNAGLEFSFAATYGEIPSGPVKVRARYFDGVDSMKPGAFLVLDDNHNIRSEAVFTHQNPETAVVFGKPALAAEPAKPASVIMTSNPVAAVSRTTSSPAQSPSSPKPWIWLAVVFMVGLGVIFWKTRRGA